MSAALIDVRLPDGSTKQLPSGASALDLAAVIGPRLAKAAVAAVVNDHETDLLAPLHSGDRVAIITVDTDASRAANALPAGPVPPRYPMLGRELLMSTTVATWRFWKVSGSLSPES